MWNRSGSFDSALRAALRMTAFSFCGATHESAAGIEPGPPDERELQGEPEVERPCRDGWVAGMVHRHVDVGGHDSDEESYESPCGQSANGWLEEQAEASEDLAEAADLDEEEMRGEIGRHDADVGLRDEEVEGSGGDEEDCEEESGKHG